MRQAISGGEAGAIGMKLELLDHDRLNGPLAVVVVVVAACHLAASGEAVSLLIGTPPGRSFAW